MQIRFPVVAVCCTVLPAVASAQCAWEALPGSPEPDGQGYTFAELDGDLYVAGSWLQVSGVADSVAIIRWNGAEWESVGGGVTAGLWTINTLAVVDGALYAGGLFAEMGGVPGTSRIAKWDGTSWSSLGGGLGDRPVYSIVEFDGELYAGGSMRTPRFVARWDGVSWSQVGDTAPLVDTAYDLTVFDDGGGPALYAACGAGVMRWNGADWTPLGDIGEAPTNLEVFDGDLFAGGDFGITRWNGGSWVSVGGGVSGIVRTMEVFDDGSGPALFVGGTFDSGGGEIAFAKWDGGAWSVPPGSEFERAASGGFPPSVEGLASIGGELYAGGAFELVGGVPAHRMARWNCGATTCYADLDGDGDLTIFDFLAFQNAFDAGDMVADCDADGDLTLFDFLCFQNAFDAGCP